MWTAICLRQRFACRWCKEKPEAKTGKTEVKAVEQPVKKVKRTVNRDEVVICRSVFDGTLCYTNPRTGESWCWNYGDEHEMTVGDLLTMSGNNKIFLTAPWIIVDAEEDIVLEKLGVVELYENIELVEDVEDLLSQPLNEISRRLDLIPKAYKENLSTTVVRLIEEEKLYDTRVIRLLEEKLEKEFR